MTGRHTIITIDGPAGSGKSTISRLLAKKLDVLYLDTGAMYRAVALQAKWEGISPHDGKALERLCGDVKISFRSEKIYLEDENVSMAIRSPEMDLLSSTISAVREVREAMTDLQRKIGMERSVVAEGRDMGTVVFPDADYKFYLTASHEIRSERRYQERVQRGESVSKNQVREELGERDRQDQTRKIAPLRPAADAVIIDSSSLSPEQVMEKILEKTKNH
jgi:cytidylate kinase